MEKTEKFDWENDAREKQKQEIESKQVMDAFRKSGKSMRELMIFLEG